MEPARCLALLGLAACGRLGFAPVGDDAGAGDDGGPGDGGITPGRCAAPPALPGVPERVVTDGPVHTAGGVTSGIDLGIHLVRLLADDATAHAIAQQMEHRSA